MDFSLSPSTCSCAISFDGSAEPRSPRALQQAEETETFPIEIFRKWGDLGLFGIRYPEADGGSGMDKVADCIVREEISAVSQSFATAWSAHWHLALWPIWRAGTPEQKERYFKPGLAGEKIGAFALSEPDTGSNIRELTTKAEKVAGGYRLRGAKLYISNAPMANFMLVAARTRPELTNEAISLFIVDLPHPASRSPSSRRKASAPPRPG